MPPRAAQRRPVPSASKPARVPSGPEPAAAGRHDRGRSHRALRGLAAGSRWPTGTSFWRSEPNSFLGRRLAVPDPSHGEGD
eukprot:5621841-Lingulodinium_polyedra.AAC.1